MTKWWFLECGGWSFTFCWVVLGSEPDQVVVFGTCWFVFHFVVVVVVEPDQVVAF